MNERIKELAKEAGLKVNADGEISPAFFGSVDAGYRKFAELIIRESANYLENEYGKSVITGNDAADFIRKHFGIKE